MPFGDTLYAFDADTGAELWIFATLNLIQSTPAVSSDDIVYFGGLVRLPFPPSLAETRLHYLLASA